MKFYHKVQKIFPKKNASEPIFDFWHFRDVMADFRTQIDPKKCFLHPLGGQNSKNQKLALTVFFQLFLSILC
jgi:hypothetical protein